MSDRLADKTAEDRETMMSLLLRQGRKVSAIDGGGVANQN